MAVNKLDPKVIFASEAPAQDTPAVFPNKIVGWGESRKNGGRPTIKQMNALQQETDLKILWLNENAVTPYDATIDYPNNAVVIKDNTFKILDAGIWKDFVSRDVVSKLKTIPTYNNAADGVDSVTGVGNDAYFNVRSENDETVAVEYQNVGGSAVATGKRYLSALGAELQEKPASTIRDESGKDQQKINNVVISQFLTTDQFETIIPEVDDTGRLQRAFDASFERKQKLHLVGDFNCSDTVYARFSFDGSASTLNYPKDYNKDALVLGAEKSTATTTRLSGAVCTFPNVETTKTSGTNDWSSNPNSCAIKVVNSQEGKFNFGTTYMFAYGVYFLAWNTDANYNQINFGRHVFHKRPMTFHVDGSVSVASMNQNILTGGRFAVSNTTSRIAGIYLMHFLITGGTLSSLNNNLILNPSVEGAGDEYAMLFESQGTNISGLAYNTIIAPRLETGSVAGKKMAFRGDRVRWNRVMQGYGVEYDSVVNENGATVNTIFSSTGAMQFVGSLGNTAVGSFQNNSGVASPTFAVYATGKTNLEMMDATASSVLYATSTNLYSRSATAKRWSLGFGNGKQEWFNASEVLLANLYAETGGLKSDYRLSLVQGIGVFGTTPPGSKRSITGKKAPTTIAEQNAVIDSIVAALSAYGLVSDDRTT